MTFKLDYLCLKPYTINYHSPIRSNYGLIVYFIVKYVNPTITEGFRKYF